MNSDTTSKYHNDFQVISITGLNELLDTLKNYSKGAFFRGQSKSEWVLIPRIARMFERVEIHDTWDRIQAFILEDFKKYAVPHITREPKNNFEWLIWGQHYGLPTRFMDWTTNPLKAAYFAVCDHIGEKDGALYALWPSFLIRDVEDDFEIENDGLVPVFSKMIDARIIVQEACFTAFPLPS